MAGAQVGYTTRAESMGADATLNTALSAFTDCIGYTCLHTLAVKVSDKFRQLALLSEQHFLPMPVRGLPSGKETGKFISIDVGGSNLRVGFVELFGESGVDGGDGPSRERVRKAHERSWPIEEHLKVDKAEDLFAWIGACIADVIRSGYAELSAAEKQELLIGITFSFPMTQTLLGEATLLPMGKGFAITSNLNLGKMLLDGYQRQCGAAKANVVNVAKSSASLEASYKLPKLKLVAIANDTISTFISVAYAVKARPNSRTAMGLIAGTGTNAAVPLKLDYFSPSKTAHSRASFIGNSAEADAIVTNTEWSVRPTGDPLFELDIPTKWDKQLDEHLPPNFRGFQPFEYMTAGRYLGEIVRLVLHDFVSRGNGMDNIPPSLATQNSISTASVAAAALESDMVSLAEPFAKFPTSLKAIVQPISKAVMDRSAALMAAYVVGLLALAGDITLQDLNDKLAKRNMDEDFVKEELVIAYTGGLISSNPGYRESCEYWMNELIRKSSWKNQGKQIVLKEAADGGVIGAAVLAGTAMSLMGSRTELT
ncbi:MAG: hypothetical protein Q9165_005753 [Trypethelium subeluteriae]